jgi:stage IV sporulation protein FB
LNKSILFKIKIHPLFWLLAAISIITAQFKVLSITFIIIFIHELGHVIAMEYFSWRVTKIDILPFGGVAVTEEFDNKPLREELIVTLAGPLMNLLFAVLLFILGFINGFNIENIKIFQHINLTLLCVNLLPIHPLDGGRIISLIYQAFFPYYKTFKLITISSLTVLLLLSIYLIIDDLSNAGNLIVLCYLMFILIFNWKNRAYIFIRYLTNRHNSFEVNFKEVSIINTKFNNTILNVLKKFYKYKKHLISVNYDGKQYIIDENELLHNYLFEDNPIKDISELKTFNK